MQKHTVSKRVAKISLVVAATIAVMVGVSACLPFALGTRARETNLDRLAVDFEDLVRKSVDVKYLSDEDVEPYRNDFSYIAYRKDATDANGTKISLKHEGTTVAFDRGLYTHATNDLFYDLEAIDPTRKYTHFVAYEGINTTSTGAGCNGVIFRVYGANEPEGEWQILDNAENRVQAQGAEARFVKVDIRGYRYLRLEAHHNGSQAKDHAAWGDAKLVTADYTQYAVPEIERYNQAVLQYGEANFATDAAYELTVLRRELMARVGQYTMSTFVQASPENRRALEWLYNDLDHMRWYILGGAARGTYLNSLNVLSQIYAAHQADMRIATRVDCGVLACGTEGELYSKMMITLSLTHSANIVAWYNSREISDALKRYEIYKDLYTSGNLETKVFARLEIEEMRQVMMAAISDDEIRWLNNLSQKKTNFMGRNLNPYSYIKYTFGYNYGKAEYYAEENREKWDTKWELARFGVPYGLAGKPRLWIVFEQGSVCGGLSKTGTNLWNVAGMPATVVGQPGHAAYIGMSMDDAGNGSWSLGNDVSGWAKSEKRERFLLGWGSPLMHSGYNVSYFPYAQDALNDMGNYILAEETLMLKDLYGGDKEKLIAMYRKALSYQSFNLDAWYGLIQLYLQDATTPEETFRELAKEVAENLKNYPLPMVKVMELVKGRITSAAGKAEYDNVQKQKLEYGKTVTATQTKQYASTRTMANYLLGQTDYRMATFSFDGENAGKIMLGSRYNDVLALQYEYSLDGGVNWTTVTITESSLPSDRNAKLSETELRQITAENDIKVRIVGANDAIYTIDITRPGVPTGLYANDQENRIIGTSLSMEWCQVTDEDTCDDNGSKWVSYRDHSPIWTGDITVRVRQGRTGTQLESVPTESHQFTEDTGSTRERSYIPVSHLSVAAKSSEALGSGKNGNVAYIIDGNFNTRWHSNWSGTDTEKYIVIKFDHSVKLSALEYVSAGGDNGHIMQADIYVSNEEELNADDFQLVGKIGGDCTDVDTAVVRCDSAWNGQATDNVQQLAARKKTFEFRRTETVEVTDDEGNTSQEEREIYAAIPVRYVAIKASQTSKNRNFIAGRMLNFYEDRTDVVDAPTASIVYSTVDYTRDDVVARLVNPSTEIKEITGVVTDGGDGAVVIDENDPTTVRFTRNGEYKFTFKDANEVEGQAIAKVTWIDREAPVAHIVYDRGENVATNKSVTAKLVIDSQDTVIVTNNQQVAMLAAGNEAGGSANAGDGEGNSAPADTLVWDPFTYTFENNGEFTFEFRDVAGNTGTATARVTWIDRAAPKVAVEYSRLDDSEGEVTARLVKVARETENAKYDENGLQYDEDFVVTNNGGAAEYRFVNNGEFAFEYCDAAENCGTAVAKVDWLKDAEKPDEPTDNPNRPSEPSGPSEPGTDEPNEEPGVLGDDGGNAGTNNDKDGAGEPDGTVIGNAGTNGGPSTNGGVGTNGGAGTNVGDGAQVGANEGQGTDSGDEAEPGVDGGLTSDGDKNGTDSKDQSIAAQRPQGAVAESGADGKEKQQAWYENPWVWAAGGVVAVAIVGVGVAMVNNRRR